MFNHDRKTKDTMNNWTLLDVNGTLIQETFKCNSTGNSSYENVSCVQDSTQTRQEPLFWVSC